MKLRTAFLIAALFLPVRATSVPIEGPFPFGAWGGAYIEVSLEDFRQSGRRHYSFATLAMDINDPHAPVLELALEGTTDRQCNRAPCGDELGLVIRYSGDPTRGFAHCGAVVPYVERLGVGRKDTFLVTVLWRPGRLTMLTPVEGRHFYLPRVGLRRLFIPPRTFPRRNTLQASGGLVRSRGFVLAAARWPIGVCPTP